MEIFILFILILLNGFFALSEIALVSSKKSRLLQKQQEGSKNATIALKLLDNSENFLSAIQIGITLIGIVTGVYGGLNIADDITPFFEKINFFKPFAEEISLTLTVVTITFFSILIGELVPKTVALSNPEAIAIKIASFIYFFSKLFFPIVKLLSISTNFINRIIGVKKTSENITETELRQMLKLATNVGVINKEQDIIHEKLFYFADKKAKHIMTHRTETEWIDIEKPIEFLDQEIRKFQHTKIICSRGSIDNIEGILFLNSYFKAYTPSLDLCSLIIEPLIVSENSDATKVLSFMRKEKKHICCVVNEFGGFEGVITLHDIIENIVGDIPDENEINDPDIFVRDDKSILVSGDASVETLAEIIPNFYIDFEIIDYSTVAGFVLDQIGNIPKLGDKFDYLDYRFEIIDLDENRIDKVLIYKKNSV